jgi:hypothetical protein
MTSKTRKVAAFAAILLSLGTVTAYAASRPPLVGVTKSSMNGVNRASGAHGALKANAVGNRQIKFGSVSCGKLSADLVAAICTGKPGAPGTPGAPGANGISGSKGDGGINGGNGSKGDGGTTGDSGHDGSNGSNGSDAPGFVTTHVAGGDSSVCGPDWANDTYTRKLQFVPQDDGTIHVIRTYKGTFVTIAGVHGPMGPCAAADRMQAGGVRGTFTGFDVVVVTGGRYFPDATCDANCTSDAMITAFFPGASRAVNNGWEYHYDAGANGTWINADAVKRGGNSGNITG